MQEGVSVRGAAVVLVRVAVAVPLPSVAPHFHPASSCSRQWLGVLWWWMVAMWPPSLSFLFPVVAVVVVVYYQNLKTK
jgi:hypothetical protein